MKKIIAIFAMTAALGANAFFNSNNTPWNSGYGNNYNGYQSDNGMFGYNPYDYWDPRWYMEEMGNMVDEFDDEFNSNGNNYGYGNNGPWNNNSWGNNAPWNNNNNTPWNNGPWNNNAPVGPAVPAK
jgi:hypothetical protein